MTDLQTGITSYWNQRSESYDASGGHDGTDRAERAAWLSTLPTLVPPPPGDVLDVGTGTGFLAGLFAELGYTVRGIDVAEAMMEKGRRNTVHLSNPPVFRQGDAHAPDVAPASVDILSSRHVLWTLHSPEEAFRNWFVALRPGGRLLCFDSLWFAESTPNPDVESQSALAAAWQSSYDETARAQLPVMGFRTLDPLLPLLEAAGFEDVQLSEVESLSTFYRQRAALPSDALPRFLVSARTPN